MKCEICGKDFKGYQGLTSHVFRKHNMLVSQYYNKFVNPKDPNKYCKICGKENPFGSLRNGYMQTYCSCRCRNLDPQFQSNIYNKIDFKKKQQKISETSLKKYGTKYPTQSEIVKQKIKNTNIKKYGVKNPAQLEIVKQKMKNTTLEKYGVQYTGASKAVRKKMYETHIERYGGIGFAVDSLRQKGINTLKKKYNVSHPMHSEQIVQKMQNTNLKKYGTIWSLSSKILRDKIKTTNLKKYGVDSPLKSPEIKEKIKITNIKKYGVDSPFKSSEIQIKCAKSYSLKPYKTKFGDIIYYQSQLQLFFIKQCQKSNKRILNGDIITYEFNNETHNYIIDFKVLEENKWRLYQIKAKHPWFYQELNTGKLKVKILAAQQYSKKMGYLPYKMKF